MKFKPPRMYQESEYSMRRRSKRESWSPLMLLGQNQQRRQQWPLRYKNMTKGQCPQNQVKKMYQGGGSCQMLLKG